MTKILKKSLACLLAFVLCFTAIASCLAVSAEAPALSSFFALYAQRPSNNDKAVGGVCEGELLRAQLDVTGLTAGTTMGIAITMPEGVVREDITVSGWNRNTACALNIVSDYLDKETNTFTMVVNVVSGGSYTFFVRFNVTENIPKNSVMKMNCTVEAANTSAAGDENIYTYNSKDAGHERPMEVKDHDVVVDAAVAATCEGTGLTEGSHCSRCEKTLVAQEEVAALGHAWGEGVVDPDATCTDEGVITYTCANDPSHTYTEAISAKGHTEVAYEEVAATCTTVGYTGGTYCSVCDAVITPRTEVPALGHNYVDGICDVCGEADPDYAPKCDHADAVATVKKQPTKDAEGVMTYTCACGETWEDSIAIPEVATTYTKLGISIEDVVGTVIDVSYKQVKNVYGENATYFLSIDYEKFGTEVADAFIKSNKNIVIPMTDTVSSLTANLQKFKFTSLALYEMTMQYNIVVYIVNAEGVVVAYKDLGTTTIANVVTAEADAGTATATLLTLYADMCNYGTALQNYFASKNAGKDICTQALPTDIFAAYMGNASDKASMPDSSFYNTTNNANKKVVAGTGFVSAGPAMNVAASNEISYTVRYDNYAWEDVDITVSYNDSAYGDQIIDVKEEEVVFVENTSQGKAKYRYVFKKLPIYDYNKTVTMKMYYKGEYECYTEYSLGAYISTYLSDASMKDILTTMVLFANSTRESCNLK